MTTADRISTRIDPKLKKGASRVFSRLGLTEAQAIRLFYAQVELKQAIPFDLKIPNKETMAAMAESVDTLKPYKSHKELMESLDD